MKIVVGLCLLMVLAACGGAAQTAVPTATVVITQAPTPTPPPAPTLTPTSLPGMVWWVAPAGDALEAAVNQWAVQSGLLFERRDALQPTDLTPQTQVVVLAAVPANLAELLAAAPQTQFVVVSGVDLAPAANLNVVRVREENRAFIAGLMTVLISTDWRGAALLPGDGPLGASLGDAFTNGGEYFCGVCAPGWPLGETYPQAVMLAAQSDGPSWQTAAQDLMDVKKVDVYYISAEAARPEIWQYLAGKQQFNAPVRVIGVQAPVAELQDQWAATLRFDTQAALAQLWPNVIEKQAGSSVDAALLIENVNEAYLGAGRMRLVNEAVEAVMSGQVMLFTIPAE